MARTPITPIRFGEEELYMLEHLRRSLKCSRAAALRYALSTAYELVIEEEQDAAEAAARRVPAEVRNACDALGVEPTWPIDLANTKAAWKRAVKRAHPDQGGDAATLIRVQNAWATLQRLAKEVA